MLNVQLIKKTMRALGLTGKDVGDACGVTKEAASNWLKGESMPRPSKLVDLAALLKLPVEQLLAPVEARPEPVVAYRMRNNRAPTVEAQEAGDEVARHLRQLVPLTAGHSFFTNRGIPEPNLSDACIDDAVAATRSLLKLSPDEKVTHDHLFQLFAKIGVILVPVFWGGDREGHENAMSVYLPDSRTTWVLFNLGCRIDDFSYWLAHELGHALTLHALQGDDGETFAERFAQKLLFPESVAAKALEAIREAGDKMATASWYAGSFDVSIVTVVKAADRVAEKRGEAPTGLNTGPFYGMWKRNRKSFPTAAQQLFGTDTPAPLEYIVKSEELFGTPVFRALAKFQQLEGRSPAFVAATLNVNVGDGLALSQALAELSD